jgi:hypothetical protein
MVGNDYRTTARSVNVLSEKSNGFAKFSCFGLLGGTAAENMLDYE